MMTVLCIIKPSDQLLNMISAKPVSCLPDILFLIKWEGGLTEGGGGGGILGNQ